METKDQNSQELQEFVKAVQETGLNKFTLDAACHHSAVEVNDWENISKKLEKLSLAEK